MATVAETGRAANRGPSAAAENRAAIIAAAREVFAEGGYDAPLNSVARAAGVGQGSLYRHFPHRTDLALAVFDENVLEIEALGARPESTLGDVLNMVTDQAIASQAFIHIITESQDPRIQSQLGGRVRKVLEAKLDGAKATGDIRPDATADEIELAMLMVTGAIASTPAAQRREVAAQCWRLLGLGDRGR
jgi:AcrR family transcriptional regulator